VRPIRHPNQPRYLEPIRTTSVLPTTGKQLVRPIRHPNQPRYLEPIRTTSVLPTTGKQLVSPIRHFNPHQNKKFARVQPCTSQQPVAIKEDKPPPLVVKKDQDVKIQEEDSKDEDITFSPGGEVAVATQMWNDFIYISMP